jgi:hypothetical protein
MMLLAAVLAMLLIAALPALAQRGGQDHNNRNNNNHHHGGGGDPGITQDNQQDADSGDVDQSFTVTGGGDNSNQCVGLQGVANTGNAQNQTGIIQYGSNADDFDFEDSGASIEVSPENSTSCDQQVNQAASASGGGR